MSIKGQNSISEAPPPSYDEVISSEELPGYSRPPPQVPRPPTSSMSSSSSSLPRPHPHSRPPPSQPNDLYTANPNLPFRYPKGFLCKKCKNTGYKIKNGKSCKDCWSRFAPVNISAEPIVRYTPQMSYNSMSMFPFSYDSIMGGGSSYGNYTNYVPVNQINRPGQDNRLPPKIVRPGDPSIGGILCGRCRGSGITHFFLDEETCNVCGGIGRVFP